MTHGRDHCTLAPPGQNNSRTPSRNGHYLQDLRRARAQRESPPSARSEEEVKSVTRLVLPPREELAKRDK